MRKRFFNYEQMKLFLLSIILYPRFKDKVFSEDYEQVIALDSLKEELEAVYNNWSDLFSISNEQEISSNNNVPTLKKIVFSGILPDYREPRQYNTAKTEIETYLNKNLLN